MQAVKTIGLDIAKSVFQVDGVDADGQVVIRRKLKRRYVLSFFEKVPTCLVGLEACATSAVPQGKRYAMVNHTRPVDHGARRWKVSRAPRASMRIE